MGSARNGAAKHHILLFGQLRIGVKGMRGTGAGHACKRVAVAHKIAQTKRRLEDEPGHGSRVVVRVARARKQWGYRSARSAAGALSSRTPTLGERAPAA